MTMYPVMNPARLAAVALVLVTGASPLWAQTEEIRRTIPIGPSGSFSLSNLSGQTSIVGSDGDDLVLVATKRVGRDGAGADAAAAALERVEIQIRERGDRVEVETDYHRGSGNGPSVSVDYEVSVPRGTEIVVESVSGNVSVEGIDGETLLEVVSGDLELTALSRLAEVEAISGNIRASDVGHDRDLTLSAVSGSVTIEGVSAPRVEIEAVSGPIALSDVSAGRVELEVVSGAVTFEGALDPAGSYDFETHSGSVRLVLPTGSGFLLEAESFSGGLDSDFPLVLGQGAGAREVTSFERGERSLEGIAGDGGAQIEVSTFSGGITIESR